MARPSRWRSATIALGNKEESRLISIVVLAIDLGKSFCGLAWMGETGAVVLRRRMKYDGAIDSISTTPALIATKVAG